jgi:hypothetical protein
MAHKKRVVIAEEKVRRREFAVVDTRAPKDIDGGNSGKDVQVSGHTRSRPAPGEKAGIFDGLKRRKNPEVENLKSFRSTLKD